MLLVSSASMRVSPGVIRACFVCIRHDVLDFIRTTSDVRTVSFHELDGISDYTDCRLSYRYALHLPAPEVRQRVEEQVGQRVGAWEVCTALAFQMPTY